jgi:hypothetical protein
MSNSTASETNPPSKNQSLFKSLQRQGMPRWFIVVILIYGAYAGVRAGAAYYRSHGPASGSKSEQYLADFHAGTKSLDINSSWTDAELAKTASSSLPMIVAI